jgi:hypothetical protein
VKELLLLLLAVPIVALSAFSARLNDFQARPRAASVPVAIDVLPPVAAVAPAVVTGSRVSDVQRYALAVMAGWTPAEAIVATAISIAENGSGEPAVLSAENWNHTRDLGLWQVNSAWWPQFGGQAALSDPAGNAQAAYAIYKRQGWCAWSTYLASCGAGHNSAFAAFIGCAQIIAGGQACQH